MFTRTQHYYLQTHGIGFTDTAINNYLSCGHPISLKVLYSLLFYSIQVTPEDVLPVTMCTSCIYKLEMCHQFVHGCLDADIKLRTIFGLEVDDIVSKRSKTHSII